MRAGASISLRSLATFRRRKSCARVAGAVFTALRRVGLAHHNQQYAGGHSPPSIHKLQNLKDLLMKADWYLDFFQGAVVDLWQQAVPPEQSRRETEFVAEMLRLPPGGRVIDVPCGFGRHSVELAARGFHVTGVDVSADFIARARKLAAERKVVVDWVVAEMRQLPVGQPFDGALCLGNSLGYIDHDGTQAFFMRLSEALRPGARFVLESGAVAESLLPNLKPKMEYSSGGWVVVDEHDYDPVLSCMQSTNTITRDGKTSVNRDWQFVFTLAEVHRMLSAAGFRVLDCFSSMEKEPYRLGSEGLYLIAEKNGGRTSDSRTAGT
jgi:SAM-dependent methyltransferase